MHSPRIYQTKTSTEQGRQGKEVQTFHPPQIPAAPTLLQQPLVSHSESQRGGSTAQGAPHVIAPTGNKWN